MSDISLNTAHFYSNINNWEEFNNSLVTLNSKQKGDAFESLTKLYFIIDHKYHNYDNIWLFSDVPKKELEKIGLQPRDLGIDLIAKKGNEYHAIQCKYHSDKSQNVTLNEVSTFLTLLGGYDKLTEGYLCSSAVSTSKNYDDVQKKHVSKLLNDTWSKLDKDFFDRVRKYLNKEKYNPIPFYPRPHQKDATNKAYNHFIKNNESRGKLIFPCGAGKSLTGFWMMEKLDSKSTLIAVPSLSLIKQTLDVYLKEIVARGIKVNWLCICSDEGIGDNKEIRFKTDDIGVPCTTSPEYIKDWLIENKDERNIIFTTYQSSKLIANISKELNHTFELGILDEAHKTVGSTDKLFSYLLFEDNISIKNRIFMTATERFYVGSKDDIVSMDDNDVYGDIFAQMTFKEAIDSELLTDYKIITIDIDKTEISDFIRENGLIQLNSVWKKETEARSLASMLALRKAMKILPIKNAVSFHSSIAKAQRNKDIHVHITENYGYEPIDTFTVSGRDKTSVRNNIIQEFASSKKALITNARCLTEGVDVPNIDCIVFADPRKSKIDIVQALGRALRIKKGKESGYVILPVIYDGKTNQIDNDNFNEIISIVRGLAANDERIVEYFKEKSFDKGKERNQAGGAEVFKMISETLSESELSEQLRVKVWEKLSRFNWIPFEQARKIARERRFKNQSEWFDFTKSDEFPKSIPVSPPLSYKNSGWINWGDFLGTGNIANFNRTFKSYKEANQLIKSYKIKKKDDFLEMHKAKIFPKDIPYNPRRTYLNSGWISWGEFLGTGSVASFNKEWLSYKKAHHFVKKLNLKSWKDWRNYSKSANFPSDIPKNPHNTYKNKGWIDMPTFLGCENKRKKVLNPRKFSEARKYVHSLNLKSGKDWLNFCNSGDKPLDIPKSPSSVYKTSGWISMYDWLGVKKKEYLSYEEAKEYLKSLNLSSWSQFRDFFTSGKCPSNIPGHPHIIYKNKGWISINDLLGYESKSTSREFREFKDAKRFVHKLKLKNQVEWTKFAKSNLKPNDIPSNPQKVYKDRGWNGLADWLGK